MNRTLKNIFFSPSLFLSLYFLSCSLLLVGQNNETHYRIYSVKEQKEISLDDIVNDMKANDVLFFGEEHNDSIAHYLEYKLLELMHGKFGKQTVLSMEMFERDVQAIMDEYIGGFIREVNFRKDARVWSNYKDYRPMIEFAKINSLSVICANAPSRYTHLAGSKGQAILTTLPETSKQFFAPLPYDTAIGAYRDKLMQTTSQHGTNTSDTLKRKPTSMPVNSFNFVIAQSLWDATMAYSIAQYIEQHHSGKVLHINGKFHSDEYFGVVNQLKKYNPKIKVLVISSCSDDSFPNIDWKKYNHQGDYIIVIDPTVQKTY